MNITEIQQWEQAQTMSDGDIIRLRGIVKNVTEEPGKNGPFVKLWLHDGKGPFFVNLFNLPFIVARNTYVAGQVYDFVLQLRAYGPDKRIVVKQLLSADPVVETLAVSKKYKPWEFKRLTEEGYHAFLSFYKENISNPKYRRYIEVAYGLGEKPDGVSQEAYDKRRRVIQDGFASINRHDNYPGGYANHVMGMLRIAKILKELYGSGQVVGRVETICEVDWDYVFTAIYLHDVGKQITYAPLAPGVVKFREGTQVTHNVAGAMIMSNIHDQVETNLRLDYIDYQNFLYTIQFHDTAEKLYEHKRVEDKIVSHCDGLDTALVGVLEL